MLYPHFFMRRILFKKSINVQTPKIKLTYTFQTLTALKTSRNIQKLYKYKLSNGIILKTNVQKALFFRYFSFCQVLSYFLIHNLLDFILSLFQFLDGLC